MDTVTIAHPRTPDTREKRALELVQAHGRAIEHLDRDLYLVPSQDGLRSYRVEYGDVETCSCPDQGYRGVSCVHLYALGLHLAKRRGSTARRLAALDERARSEDLPADERLEVLDEAARLRRRLGL